MPLPEEGRLRERLTALTARYGRHRSALIPILTEIKADGHDIGSEAMQIVADALDIHPVEVYGVASFYAFLHPQRQGRFVFRLCKTLSCELQGKAEIAEALQAELGIGFGQTSDDGLFTLEWAACLGMCDQGPALLVNDVVHTRLTTDRVRQIVAECRECAPCVPEVTA